MKPAFLVIATLLLTNSLCAQSRHDQIKAQLKQLTTLVGNWEVASRFESRSGEVRMEEGSAQISWALDSTYFQWSAQLVNVETGRQRKYISWITFDTKEEAYRQTYLYSRTDNIITNHGEWDPASQTLTSSLSLVLSDGTNELLRTELSLLDPNVLVSLSYAKFDDAEEVNNMQMTLKRMAED